MIDLHGMTEQRYLELDRDYELDLTPEETKAGWHFCPDWDYLLIHNRHVEIEGCCCNWKEGKQ